MEIFTQLSKEITAYLTKPTNLANGHSYSQPNLVNRLHLYMNKIYPEGKIDSQGDYKYWFDIISPRVNDEVKNIDFDTKDILIYSEQKKDFLAMFIANASLSEWMRENHINTEINESIENGAAWGNIVWKKVKDGFEQVDLKEFYVLHQKAKTLNDSPVIEHHLKNQTDLRKKKDVWKNVDEVIKNCGDKFFSKDMKNESPSPVYEIYERNGEVSERIYNECKGKKGGSDDKFKLAKIIVAGISSNLQSKDAKFVLYCDEIKDMGDIYKEYHRGKYTGRWLREGLYEILFDLQTRANQIGNELAKGLEWASKVIFRTGDNTVVQNILTDLENGDLIKAKDLEQINVRLQGFDQLIADWNRVIEQANALANSFEVTQGETMPSGTPFRMGAMLNINANKLFDYLQEKVGIVLEDVFESWILPDLMKSLKAKEVLRLTNNSNYLKRWNEMLVESWYVRNLVSMPPHPKEYADIIKAQKLDELMQRPEAIIKLTKDLFADIKPRMNIVITGENVRKQSQMETLATTAQIEADPIRRSAIIERINEMAGIDISDFPKTEAPEITQPANTSTPQQPNILDNILKKQATMAV